MTGTLYDEKLKTDVLESEVFPTGRFTEWVDSVLLLTTEKGTLRPLT